MTHVSCSLPNNKSTAAQPTADPLLTSLVRRALSADDGSGCDNLIELHASASFPHLCLRHNLMPAVLEFERTAFGECRTFARIPKELIKLLPATTEFLAHLLVTDRNNGADSEILGTGSFAPLLRSQMTHQATLAWAHLACQQLDYLATCHEWSQDHLALMDHALTILEILNHHWRDGFRGQEQCAILPTLVGSVRELLSSALFRQLFDQHESEYALDILSRTLAVARCLDDLTINGGLVCLLPAIYSMCRKLEPWEYCANWSREQHALETTVQRSAPGPSEDDNDIMLAELMAEFSTTSSLNERDALWSDLFEMTLQAIPTAVQLDQTATTLLGIVRESPFGIRLYQLALDSLALAFPESTQVFVPQLARRAVLDDRGVVYLLSLVSLGERSSRSNARNYIPDVTVALRALDDDERKEILETAASLIAEQCLELGDLDLARRSLEMLRAASLT